MTRGRLQDGRSSVMVDTPSRRSEGRGPTTSGQHRHVPAVATPRSMGSRMAASARVLRSAVRGARRPRSTGGSAPAFPLRDWRRAFALVDAIKAEYADTPWFRGVRASRDPRSEAIVIEVEVAGPESLSGGLSARLLALGVRLRTVSSESGATASP